MNEIQIKSHIIQDYNMRVHDVFINVGVIFYNAQTIVLDGFPDNTIKSLFLRGNMFFSLDFLPIIVHRSITIYHESQIF